QLAIYGRERGMMKDMPALLTAILAARGSALLPVVFARVINNGLEKELQQLKDQAAAQESANLSSKAVDLNGVKLLVSELAGIEP
ncbi:hypothetical protein MJN47_31440, partial [Salmonella enterica subsp. enterica serovar Lubbock]|nr:hypothetical protein [Salmonella enterica subsp. enterica serovar Lubbock]